MCGGMVNDLEERNKLSGWDNSLLLLFTKYLLGNPDSVNYLKGENFSRDQMPHVQVLSLPTPTLKMTSKRSKQRHVICLPCVLMTIHRVLVKSR